jgi:hypothetical protein
MKHILLAIAVMTAGSFTASTAEACSTQKQARNPCDAVAPTGHKFSGNQVQKLELTVTVCHPNWGNLNRKWYSYAIFTDGQLNRLVRSLKKTGKWSQEIELPEGQRCHQRSRGSNWQFAVFDPCVVKGYNVLRIGRPRADREVLDSLEDWAIVRGADGKPLLFAL